MTHVKYIFYRVVDFEDNLRGFLGFSYFCYGVDNLWVRIMNFNKRMVPILFKIL